MRKPYIGITGFMTRGEVEDMLNLMPSSSNRLLMVGVLASWKTLYDNKVSGRYPSIKNISKIFVSHPLALNLIHYNTRNMEDLCDQLVSLTMFGGKNLHGFQLNFTWPPIPELAEYRSICRDNIIVMVITSQAFEFEDAKRSPRLLASRIEDYKGLVDYVLLDRSGGCGMPLDTAFMREYLNVLYAKDLDMGIGIAGGLSENTLNLVEPLIADFPDLSFDAEDKLRNPHDDSLNLGLAQDYLRKSLEIFGGHHIKD